MVSKEYVDARERARAAMAEARKIAETAFETEAMALLKELQIESFSWIQYTPYFNDGDVCEFGVHNDADSLEINGEDYYTSAVAPKYPSNVNYQTPEGKAAYQTYNEQKEASVYGQVSKFLHVFDEDDMHHMFGDHVKVTVTKSGITKEDYEHD